MSWTATGEAVNGEVSVSTNGESWSKETTQQISQASLAVQDIIKSGALGEPLGEYNVSMTGHANTDHEPVSGVANDFMTISISQIGDPNR